MTHMDVIDGYLASNRIKYCRFDDTLGVRRGLTSELVNGKLELKPSLALRIEQVTGLDAADLLCRQAKWQLEQLRERDQVESQHPMAAWFQKHSGWAVSDADTPENSASEGRLAIDAWNAAIEHALAFVIPDGNPVNARDKIEQLLYKNGESQ